MRISAIAFFACVLGAGAVGAAEKGVGDKNGPSNFDRVHQAIDRNMGTGNDRSPPLGAGAGERTGLGGGPGGGNQPGGANDRAVNQR